MKHTQSRIKLTIAVMPLAGMTDELAGARYADLSINASLN